MKEKLFFRNSQGLRLWGILSNPTSQKERPVIVLCHGFFRSKDGRTYLQLEKILNSHNISTFRFDFFGHGESEGKFEDITISEAVDNVWKAVQFLKESGWGKIGLFGSSFGGMAGLIAASKTDDLYVLALKSPVSDYGALLTSSARQEEIKVWREKGYTILTDVEGKKRRLNYSFFRDSANIQGHKAAEKIRIPTLIAHGSKDVTVPLKQSQKTASMISDCRLEIIEGADHIYSQPEHFQKMLDLVSDFIIQHS
ncbi:MAG: alpha/beta hydrolase family protein [Candidatus Aminicenantes bacterium]